MKGSSSTYRPAPGTACLISPPNSDDGHGNYTFGEFEVLWTDATFIVYRHKDFWPCVNKWVHVICKPMVQDNQTTEGVKMKSIYAIAYMTENMYWEKDLYVEIVSASSRAEAIGLSMEEGRGCEILVQGEKIVSYNVAEYANQDAICDTAKAIEEMR